MLKYFTSTNTRAPKTHIPPTQETRPELGLMWPPECLGECENYSAGEDQWAVASICALTLITAFRPAGETSSPQWRHRNYAPYIFTLILSNTHVIFPIPHDVHPKSQLTITPIQKEVSLPFEYLNFHWWWNVIQDCDGISAAGAARDSVTCLRYCHEMWQIDNWNFDTYSFPR